MAIPRFGVRSRLYRFTGRQSAEATARELSDTRREVEQLSLVVELLAKRLHHNLPLPPAELRLHVGMRPSAANFLAQGSNSSERVLEVFGDSPPRPVLDWGCGSGRTLRWLFGYPVWRERYHGCDVDAEAVNWLRQNGVTNVVACNDDPPLPYPAATFGGIFSFSVLTHIPAEKHRAWYEELRRVLESGGRAYLTTQGAAVVNTPQYGVPEENRREFNSKGHTYVRHEGHYKDAALVSEGFTRRMLEGLFEIEYYRERGYQNMDDFLVRAV